MYPAGRLSSFSCTIASFPSVLALYVLPWLRKQLCRKVVSKLSVHFIDCSIRMAAVEQLPVR